jgi:hypothetical protein
VMFVNGVFVKARALIDAEEPGDAAADRAGHSADNSANRASGAIAVLGSFGGPSDDALGCCDACQGG